MLKRGIFLNEVEDWVVPSSYQEIYFACTKLHLPTSINLSYHTQQ